MHEATRCGKKPIREHRAMQRCRAALWLGAAAGSMFSLALPMHSIVGAAPAPAPTTGLKSIAVGVRPPDFTYDVGDGPRLLSANFGRPVVLNFWATWCEPCRAEMNAFETVQREFGDRITVLMLSSEDAGVARSFFRNWNIGLPLVEDPQHKIFDAYSIGPIPVTIVLHPNGAVSNVVVGELEYQELKAAVDATLASAAAGPVPSSR
jgi:thiol-disulfide isomerase/thioredoxin